MYRLFTNIQYVWVRGVQIYCDYVVLEPETNISGFPKVPPRIRGFHASRRHVFNHVLSCGHLEYEPKYHVSIHRRGFVFKDGTEFSVVLSRVEYDLDVSDFTQIGNMFPAIDSKVLEYWLHSNIEYVEGLIPIEVARLRNIYGEALFRDADPLQG